MKEKKKPVRTATTNPHEAATSEEVMQAVEKFIKKYRTALENLAKR